jgi:hypothetical protein
VEWIGSGLWSSGIGIVVCRDDLQVLDHHCDVDFAGSDSIRPYR